MLKKTQLKAAKETLISRIEDLLRLPKDALHKEINRSNANGSPPGGLRLEGTREEYLKQLLLIAVDDALPDAEIN